MKLLHKTEHKSKYLYGLRESKFTLIAFTVLAFGFNSCKKLVEADPPVTGVAGSAVYTTNGSAISALTGIYAKMGTGSFATGSTSISLFSGLSADELVPYSGLSSTDTKNYYFKNALYANSTSITPGTECWSPLYNYIFTCNSALEGLTNSTTLTASIKQQLIGEAKFMRAFFYFYLVNLYGDVPLILTSDYTFNASFSRTSKTQVFQQIIFDLSDAQSLLSNNYLDQTLLNASTEKIRPTQWAATAFLARVYLYVDDFVNAEKQATTVINNPADSLTTLNNVFSRNSPEAIWQLQPVVTGHNTEDAWIFILPSTGPSSSYPVYISTQLLNSFEASDKRKVNGNWINSVTVGSTTYYYPFKYKSAALNANVSEYLMVLRLAEQYLIRAEARAQLGNLTGVNSALSDLNIIRRRSGLSDYVSAMDKVSILTAVLHERQVELFTEWGHRWLDLKRTGTLDALMGTPGGVCAAKGGTWNSNWALYPIWLYDLQKDQNLSQNQGY